MKKPDVFFVVVITLFMVLPATAQQRIGFVGGLNIANLRGVDQDGEDINLSGLTLFGFGGVLELGLSKNIALHLEPMYLKKGGVFEGSLEDLGSLEDFPAKFKFKVAYLEVPVLVKLAIESTSKTQLYFLAGPTLGLLLNSKLEINSPAVGLADEVNFEGLSNFIDFGLSLGVGMSFPNSIFVEGRYTLGLYNVVDDGKASAGDFEFDFEEGVDVKTRGFQIMAGITFPFGEY